MKKYLFLILLLSLGKISVLAQWGSVFESVDEITGKKSFYMHSKKVTSTEPMNFPYKNTKAYVGIGCEKGNEWAYIGFSISPNLLDTEIHDGYNSIQAKSKWDERIKVNRFTQTWGSKFINFTSSWLATKDIERSKEFLLELKWHGTGKVYFKFPITRGKERLSELRKKCRAN